MLSISFPSGSQHGQPPGRKGPLWFGLRLGGPSAELAARAAAASGTADESPEAISSRQAVLLALLYLSYVINVMSQSSLEIAMPLAANDTAVALYVLSPATLFAAVFAAARS